MFSGGSLLVSVKEEVHVPQSGTDNVTFSDLFSQNYNFCDMIPVPLIPMALNGNTASGLGPIPKIKQTPSLNVNMNLNLQQQFPVIDLTTPDNEIQDILPLFQIQDGNTKPAGKQTEQLSANKVLRLKLGAKVRYNLKQRAEKENSEQAMWSNLHRSTANMSPQNHVLQPERKSNTNVKTRTKKASCSPKLVAKKDPKNKEDKKLARISRAHLQFAKTTSKPSEQHPQLSLLDSKNVAPDPVISKTTAIEINSFLNGYGNSIANGSMTFHSNDDINGAVSNLPAPIQQTMGSLVDAAFAEIFDIGASKQTVAEPPHLDEPQSMECIPNAATRQNSESTASMPEDAYVINGLDYYSSYYGPGYTNDPAMYFDDPTKPPVLSTRTTNDSTILPLHLLNDPEIMDCLESLEEMLGEL